MKIDGLQPQDVYKSYMSSAVRGDGAGSDTEKAAASDISADRVEISPESADLSEARELVAESGISADLSTDAPSRSDKVGALKSQVESGEYNVASEDVAKSILTGNYLDSRA